MVGNFATNKQWKQYAVRNLNAKAVQSRSNALLFVLVQAFNRELLGQFAIVRVSHLCTACGEQCSPPYFITVDKTLLGRLLPS